MVNTGAKFLLTQTLLDPKLVSRVTNATEAECWRYLDDLRIELNRCTRERDEEAVRMESKEWAEGLSEAVEIKRQLMLERLKEAKKRGNKKEIEGRLKQFKLLTKKIEGVSSEEIARAREYPITDLIEHRRLMAKCPFHPDKTASLYLKNNFYHCFGCQASGDSIDLYREIHSVDFLVAVKALT